MNFISTFDELNKLYEEAAPAEAKKVSTNKKDSLTELGPIATAALTAGASALASAVGTNIGNKLTEDDEEIEIIEDEVESEDGIEEITVEDPVVEDEPRQIICECSKCGALVIVDDVVIDEETDLVNVKDKCKFCEEKEGYKIIGYVMPYESEDQNITTEENIEEASDEESEEDSLE